MNFASLINKSQLLNEEQILSFKSWAYLRREAVRNLQNPPCQNGGRGGFIPHMISLGGLHIQLYISKCLIRSGYAPADTGRSERTMQTEWQPE